MSPRSGPASPSVPQFTHWNPMSASSVVGGLPPSTSTVLRAPPATKATRLPSGENAGESASSVPGIEVSSSSSHVRVQSLHTLASLPITAESRMANTTLDPSGESAAMKLPDAEAFQDDGV